MAGEWGTREEFLHPRDSHGRFRKSWKMAAGVIEKISAAIERFNPKTFPDQENANNYVKSLARSDRYLTNTHAAIDRFLRGFSKVNADLRAGKTDSPDVAAMDKAMRPLPDDLILSRVVGPEAFGLDASSIHNMEEYTGKLVADKGFSSTNVGPPHRRQGGITMVIQAPAGTKAVAPSIGTPTSEIILDRDQPFRITKVTPDGTGGYYVMAVATPKSEAPSAKTLGTKAPTPNVAEVNQPSGIPEYVPQAPQTPAAPQAPAPQAPAAPQAAPVRTGKPGRPAGPPPAPRTEPVHAEAIGTGTPSTPQAPQQPTPNAPEAPATPTPEASTPEAPMPPDRRSEFRDAFKKADIPVPSQGPRRATYNKAFLDLSLRKGDPAEIAHRLDDEIALNDATIKSDRLDGTDSGPLPEDNERLKKFSQFLKDHFGLEGAKPQEEKSPAPAKAAEKTVPSAPEPKKVAPEKPATPTGRQPGKAIPSNDFLKPGDKVYRSNGEVKTIKSVGEAGEVTYTDGTKSRDRHRLHEDSVAGAADRFAAKKTATRRGGSISPEERAARAESRAATRGPAAPRQVQQNVPLAEPSADATKVRDQWLKDAGVNYNDLSDFEKTGVNLMAEQVASGKLSRPEAKRRLEDSSLDNLKKVGGSVSTTGAKKAAPKASEAPKTEAPKAPERAAPQIPAKDLSDKGLMQRFDAEIKKDNPDAKRLKELGDELDRRDLESNEQIKRMSDDDLEKAFQDEIRKDNLDQVKVDRLGAELDRRDAERAKNESKIDTLVAKGRSYQDAYAEVHGKDPAKMDAEERQASVDAQRRPGESREATIRRLYEDDLRRQYLDAEKVTNGHLLTPEGRSKGINPRELFQGNSIRSNRWASDELKEYWQKNPRKTYTQFKADLLKRPEDVAKAKKTQGIQKDLDLGMKIERGPRKKITSIPQAREEIAKMSVPEIRTAAKERGIDMPVAATKAQDVDALLQGMAKQEQVRRAGPAAPSIDKMTVAQLREEAKRQNKRIPSSVTRKADIVSFLKSDQEAKVQSQAIREGVKGALEKQAGAEVPKPERLTPHMAVGKTNASRVQIGERVLVREGPDGRWRAAGTKTGATPITVTEKRATTKGGLHRSRGGYQIVGEDDNGNKIEVQPGPGIQTYWTAPAKSASVPEAPKVETPKPETPKPKAEKGLAFMTVPEMRKHAEEKGIKIPKALRLKKEIEDWLADALVAKERGEEPIHVPTQTEIKRANRAARARLREMDRVKRAQIREEKIKAAQEKANAKLFARAAKPPTLPGAPERYAYLGTLLKEASSREEAQDILRIEKLTVPQLRGLADSLNIAVRGNKNDILRDLVHWTVGRRLDSAAVSKPQDTGAELRALSGFHVPEGLKVSTKSVLPNQWGTTSGEVNFHADGHLGRALATLGHDGLLEVPGENDNVTNVIGKLATDAVRGKITQNELIKKVQSVRDKMSASTPVRRALDRALKQMETPEIKKLPDLPEGTPTPIKELMKNLADVPLARTDRIGHTDSTELRKLADIMEEWSKGRMTPLSLIQALRNRVLNQRHESEEGKFQIDDLVRAAIKKLEEILRTDRKSLYPPISRS